MNIRRATAEDFEALYALGSATPEFKVSTGDDFMEREEFLSAIIHARSTFVLAEEGGDVVGFAYANRQDSERGPDTQWACLVYLVVKPAHRKLGIAQDLYDACHEELKSLGITHVYAWANTESDGSIINFMKKNGYAEGHKYVWMDKEI